VAVRVCPTALSGTFRAMRKSQSPGRPAVLLHVYDDFVAAQEPGLERRVEAGEARRPGHRETLSADRLKQARAVALVGGLRPATVVSLGWLGGPVRIVTCGFVGSSRVSAVIDAGRTIATVYPSSCVLRWVTATVIATGLREWFLPLI
jgi:hypothetical protein